MLAHAQLLLSGQGEYHLCRQTFGTIVRCDNAVHDDVLLFLLFVTIVQVIVVVDKRHHNILAILRKPHGMVYIRQIPEQKLR